MSYDSRTIKIIAGYPLTWLSTLTIAGIEWAFYYWFQPSLIMMIAAIVTGLLSLLMWPILFTRSDSFFKLYYKLPTDPTTLELEKIERLESNLTELGSTQGTRQISTLQEKLDSLNEVLKRRFDSGELTFGRYIDTARQVYLSAIDNLLDVEVSLRSVNSIDVEYIDNRINELRAKHERPNEQIGEIETLEQRLLLHDTELKKVSELLTQNETAVTALVNVATAIAGAKTGKDQSLIDTETAMAELEMLAKRAKKYSKKA
ncbi:MAG: hypothetical protein H8E17_03730 [Deltaproteobacteria bacterium]|nr:hypothetical protein [Deltaproteobacteria bacterium]